MSPKNKEKYPTLRFTEFNKNKEKRKLKEFIQNEIKGKAKASMIGGKEVYLETNYLNGGNPSYVDSPSNVDTDDVLILWDGSQAGTVYHGVSGALGSTLKAYRPLYNGDFLYQYLKLNQEKIYNSYRTPNIPHVIKSFTDEFFAFYTVSNEQKQIGLFFGQFDALINNQEKRINQLNILKKYLLNKLFI